MTTTSTSGPLTRRDLLKHAAVGSFALAASHVQSVLAADEKSQPLRVIAYNVYNCTGWPKDRALANKATALGQMPDRFANELALYAPDIINFSESPSEEVAKEIAQGLGMNYVRFPSGGNWPGTLLSRFEIVDPRNVPLVEGERPQDLFTRHWGQATVKLPGGESLVVHSAHLHPSPEPDTRLREIPLMLRSMQKDLDAGRSMLLIGDLNHTPDTKEYKLWIEAGWTDTFTKAGQGNGLTIKADTPERRIDYVMAAGPIAKNIVESRPLFEGAFRTNPTDPESFALSDHLPQLAVFK
ncbi:Endonuclease/Exonuclease/phosphatase family protein [Bremerella volcania]|uniref:Endonuclease/Exonuclease/phosphatase family protein n=1 Tax=Bremerella volcania TaxID=2527984 RepID=A0A518C4C2_9BACT|nr:endonuclease/exonuclease/phosphatase family protein [Bremerella volcania]QDU74070.1 Endonuclease/Exonuclease/phosphatase family protein [Bremerella volcania]